MTGVLERLTAALADRYRIERELGAGGMATLYLAEDDAIRIASQVASALDYAHRNDVSHRDIKPENIVLHDGSALVADFGIALAASKAGCTPDVPANAVETTSVGQAGALSSPVDRRPEHRYHGQTGANPRRRL